RMRSSCAMRLRGGSRGSGQPGPRVLDHLCGGGWLPSSVMVETAPSDFDARNGLVVARIPRDTDMDAIGPLGWRKLVPFAPVVTGLDGPRGGALSGVTWRGGLPSRPDAPHARAVYGAAQGNRVAVRGRDATGSSSRGLELRLLRRPTSRQFIL